MDVSKEALFFDMKNHSRECGYTIYIHTQREEVRYHYHEYYEVFLTETDGIIHYVNGKEEVLSGGSLVFIRPQDKHTIYCDKDFRYINLNFSPQIFEKLLEYLDDEKLKQNLLCPENPPVVVISEAERKDLYEKIYRVGMLCETKDARSTVYMRRILLDIIAGYFAEVRAENRQDIPEWLRYTLHQMEKPDNFRQGVPRMVEISGKTIQHLGRCMQKHKGMKPTAYINMLRMEYAISLLLHSDLTVLEVGLESGFQSEAYFYQMFVQQTGMSPGKYREIYKEQSHIS